MATLPILVREGARAARAALGGIGQDVVVAAILVPLVLVAAFGMAAGRGRAEAVPVTSPAPPPTRAPVPATAPPATTPQVPASPPEPSAPAGPGRAGRSPSRWWVRTAPRCAFDPCSPLALAYDPAGAPYDAAMDVAEVARRLGQGLGRSVSLIPDPDGAVITVGWVADAATLDAGPTVVGSAGFDAVDDVAIARPCPPSDR